MSGRGGPRQNAGRKPGSPTKKTREVAVKAASLGITPLEFMLQVMRSECPPGASDEERAGHFNRRFEAAKAAAPYIHPRLASINAQQNVQGALTSGSDRNWC